MSQTRDRWLGLIPGLLMGAAGIAKGQGWIGGGLTPAEAAGNNAGWANSGKGLLPNGEVNPAMQQPAGAPMQLPGATLAALKAHSQQPDPAALAGMFPGALSGGLSGSPTLPSMAATQPHMPDLEPQWRPPPAPVAGLLSDPNEETRRRFLQSQGLGPAMNVAMR